MNIEMRTTIPVLTVLLLANFVFAQHKHHDHGESDKSKPPVAKPKVFLDKSPRVVEYQLKRLDNERLLLVDRATDDKKYAPVYRAILTRAGMSPQYREEAVAGLIAINKSNPVVELIAALETVKPGDRQQTRTSRELAGMLLQLTQKELANQRKALAAATASENSLLRPVGYAGMVVAGDSDAAWDTAQKDDAAKQDWLKSVALIPRPKLRNPLRESILGLLADTQPIRIRRSAIQAIAFIPAEQRTTFQTLAPFVSEATLRDVSVRSILRISAGNRDAKTSAGLVDVLVKHAEATPAAERTTDDFIDAMQLADQLMASVSVEAARAYRARLREITVRVVRIHTVEEEMRYDLPYFAVEAGRPVQVILKNEDLMPHNLVVATPGSIEEVAELGLAAGPAKQYIPDSPKVLHATGMVNPEQQERLTFTAPMQPGEYPYVCTFPRHWMRMYGVMVVVKDLDEWLKNPVEPKDPVGSNRKFVQNWKLHDLKDDLESGLRGRTVSIGERIFKEASCAQCHKVKGQGGAVGPELTDVFKRWKGDKLAVLREILEPSHRIDPKYAVHLVVTTEGKTVSGIVSSEDKTSVSLLINPEAKEPTVIKKDDIDEMVKTSTSMMPKALLDRFTKDEVFELVAYLLAANPG